jgi:alpha-amylase
MKYHWQHFSGIDYNAKDGKKAIYRIVGQQKDWAPDVSKELGNYDYLMFADLDYAHPEVRTDVLNWVEWLSRQLPLSGMRLDAAKHYSYEFQKTLVDLVRRRISPDWFIVSEYWSGEYEQLLKYLAQMDESVAVFDAALVYRFSKFSRTEGADLRLIYEKTLVKYKPNHAVVSIQT